MPDINLLPWRQAFYAHSQRKDWFYRVLFVGIALSIWVGLHSAWVIKNHQLEVEILLLKNQLHARDHATYLKDIEGLNQIKEKQKMFWGWFRVFDCLSQHHIQLTKVDYQVPPIFLLGRVASMMDFSNALAGCHFPINPKITLHPLRQSDFLQFSISE